MVERVKIDMHSRFDNGLLPTWDLLDGGLRGRDLQDLMQTVADDQKGRATRRLIYIHPGCPLVGRNAY